MELLGPGDPVIGRVNVGQTCDGVDLRPAHHLGGGATLTRSRVRADPTLARAALPVTDSSRDLLEADTTPLPSRSRNCHPSTATSAPARDLPAQADLQTDPLIGLRLVSPVLRTGIPPSTSP
jgi:hypothetical protein